MDIEELKKEVEKLELKLNTRLAIQAVNTKWMIVVGLIILAFLGYTSFISVPADAKKASKEAVEKEVGPEVHIRIKKLLGSAENANTNLSKMEKNWRSKDLVTEVSELKQLANKKLKCRAIPTEERRNYGTCSNNEFKLVQWCSGDCTGDDAKVTICCKYE